MLPTDLLSTDLLRPALPTLISQTQTNKISRIVSTRTGFTTYKGSSQSPSPMSTCLCTLSLNVIYPACRQQLPYVSLDSLSLE